VIKAMLEDEHGFFLLAAFRYGASLGNPAVT
jgi:hypothetical protein